MQQENTLKIIKKTNILLKKRLLSYNNSVNGRKKIEKVRVAALTFSHFGVVMNGRLVT